MARPKVQDVDKRSVIFTLRLTSAELQKLHQLAQTCGVSPRILARDKIFKARFPGPKLARIDIDVYSELKKIGTNINQLARHANSGRFPYGISSALRELSEQQQFIIKLLLNDSQPKDR